MITNSGWTDDLLENKDPIYTYLHCLITLHEVTSFLKRKLKYVYIVHQQSIA